MIFLTPASRARHPTPSLSGRQGSRSRLPGGTYLPAASVPPGRRDLLGPFLALENPSGLSRPGGGGCGAGPPTPHRPSEALAAVADVAPDRPPGPRGAPGQQRPGDGTPASAGSAAAGVRGPRLASQPAALLAAAPGPVAAAALRPSFAPLAADDDFTLQQAARRWVRMTVQLGIAKTFAYVPFS